MPVSVRIEKDFPARPDSVDSITGLGLRGPSSSRTVNPVDDDVQFQECGRSVEAPNRVATAERPLLRSATYEHHVLATSVPKLGQVRACQANAPHTSTELADVDHFQLQRLYARDPQQPGRQRKRYWRTRLFSLHLRSIIAEVVGRRRFE